MFSFSIQCVKDTGILSIPYLLLVALQKKNMGIQRSPHYSDVISSGYITNTTYVCIFMYIYIYMCACNVTAGAY